MTLAMLTVFAGYTVASYGWILTRGYDIRFRDWVNPVGAYQWPAAGTDIPKVPQGQIFPSA